VLGGSVGVFSRSSSFEKANLKNPNTHKPTDATQKELKDELCQAHIDVVGGLDATQKELKDQSANEWRRWHSHLDATQKELKGGEEAGAGRNVREEMQLRKN
jgi:hypothetical protein